jgi:hypothetical protein
LNQRPPLELHRARSLNAFPPVGGCSSNEQNVIQVITIVAPQHKSDGCWTIDGAYRVTWFWKKEAVRKERP